MAFSEEVFDRMVQQAFEELPKEYREACKDLSIRTEALASPELMSELHIADPYRLLGLYHGINLAKKRTFQLQMLPNEVLIFREAIAAYAVAGNMRCGTSCATSSFTKSVIISGFRMPTFVLSGGFGTSAVLTRASEESRRPPRPTD